MKKIYTLLTLIGILLCSVSCNDEWKEEQFKQLVSFKAEPNGQGVTPVYVRYKPDGKVTFLLPLIVSGTLTNDKNMAVRVALDPDTLAVMNQERFSSRTALFYKQLEESYYEMPQTVDFKAGNSIGLLPISFSLKDIDLVDKWVLPLTIETDPSNVYQVNMRKYFRKALLRIFPFNNYSGEYSATAYKTYFKEEVEKDPIPSSYKTAYVADENTVFFYAGLVNEDWLDRKNYKIFVRFNDEKFNDDPDDFRKTLTITTDNPLISLKVIGTPTYLVDESMDATLPYLKNVNITVALDYEFTDYTTVPGQPLVYHVTGSLTLLRKINTQIPDEDQAIQW